mgnify:FL=1
MNFVLSVNDNSTYFSFLEKATSLYKKLGHKVYIAYVTKKRVHTWHHLDADRIVIIPEIEGCDSGIQAKLARGFLASKLDEESFLTLMDVDQFLMDFDWIGKNIKSEYLEENDLIGFGANGYDNHQPYTPNINGKFPISYITAKPRGYRKLFGINTDCTFESFITKFSTIENPRDGFESTKNMFNHFSDESLFAWLIQKNNIKVMHIDLPGAWDMKQPRRIDRSIQIMLMFKTPNFDINFWKQTSLTVEQKNMIMDGYFLDCCPCRPYEKYADLIDDIVKTIVKKETAWKT